MAQMDGGEAVERRAPSAGKVAAGAGIALGVTLVTGGTAHATDFTVTNLDPAGPGSLRDAIDQANSNSGPDRVLFQSGLSGTIHLNDPNAPGSPYYALDISEAVDVVGPGADQITVSGDARSRVFRIEPQTYRDDVSISGLKIIQGNIKYSTYDGCCVFPVGGNIYSEGADLTLTGDVIRTGAAYLGGGVYERYGTLAIHDSTVAGNTANVAGGGVIIGYNPTEHERPVITGQSDQQPIQPSVITGSTFSNNAAGTKYNFDRVPAKPEQGPGGKDLTVPSPRRGGGGGVAADSGLTVENSTFDGNTATGQGGGINFYGDINEYSVPGAGALNVRSATVSGNVAGSSGGIYWYAYNSANTNYQDAPNPVIENSIVAVNRADGPENGHDLGGIRAIENPPPPPPQGADDSTPTDATFDTAFSLIKDTTGVTINETVPGSNIVGQDPNLAALNDNGGPTQTMALQPGSPAIDHGRTPAGETTDQRGQTRPFDLPQIGNSAAPGADGADMGAFEVQGAVPTGTCEGKPATISGTENRDVLTGTAGDDVIVGFGGNDIIKALKGNDLVCAGDGQDQVTGGFGNDELHGEGGKDRMTGQAGNDTVLDDAGDDQLNGGVGNDIVKGGAGQDRILGSKGNDRLFGQAADDVILGAKGNDFIRGGAGNDRVNGGVGVNNVQQ
jgi:Ca2+-binding RTX toxin-like protein